MRSRSLKVFLTVIFVIFMIALMVTVSIGLPIYGRFFYYIQIKTLHLEDATGLSFQEIKTAYDAVLNYLTLPGGEFSTGGIFVFSEEGASHFADCKVLFNVNLGVMLSSAAVMVVYGVLVKLRKIELCRPGGHSSVLLAAILAIVIPVVIAGLMAIVGWDESFEIFHAIFFPGKDNWLFNPRTDPVINIMPDEFFLNCAIIIGCGLVAFAIALIIYDSVTRKRRLRREDAVPTYVSMA